jgi:hypothetical protein
LVLCKLKSKELSWPFAFLTGTCRMFPDCCLIIDFKFNRIQPEMDCNQLEILNPDATRKSDSKGLAELSFSETMRKQVQMLLEAKRRFLNSKRREGLVSSSCDMTNLPSIHP